MRAAAETGAPPPCEGEATSHGNAWRLGDSRRSGRGPCDGVMLKGTTTLVEIDPLGEWSIGGSGNRVSELRLDLPVVESASLIDAADA
jgi:hypothetical protein